MAIPTTPITVMKDTQMSSVGVGSKIRSFSQISASVAEEKFDGLPLSTKNTSLNNIVPMKYRETIINVRRHEIIVQKSSPLYKAFSAVEDATLIASSGGLITVSVASVVLVASKIGFMQ